MKKTSSNKKPAKKTTRKTAKKPSIRKEAEGRLAKQKERLRELSATDLKKLVHELRTHQIELEMQNEELRQAQAGIVRDITERKLAEAERDRLLEEVERRATEQDAVFKVLPYLISVHDQDGKYLRVNQSVVDLFGFDPTAATREEIARRVRAHFPDGTPLTPANMPSSRALQGESVREVEYVVTNERGEEHVLLLNALPLKRGEQVYGAVLSQLDITERKRAEETLRLSEEKFAKVFANNPAAIAMTRLEDGLFLDVNDTWVTVNGYSRDEVIGLSARKLPIWPSAEAATRFVQELRKEGSVRGWEQEFRKKSGEVFVAQLSAQILTVRGEQVIVSTLVDMTARKKAEEALQSSEQRLRLFVEHAPASLAMFDREMRYLSVSHRWLNDYGLGERDLLGISHYDVFPEIPEHWKEIHRRALGGEVVRNDSDRFDRADGSVQWLRWEVRPWYDATGAVAGIVVFSEDITTRKQAEDALRESEEQFRTLADSIPNLAWWANADGYITWYNRRWYEYTGTRPEQMEGWGWQSVHDPKVLPKVLEQWQTSIATGQPFDMEFPLLGADGVFRSFLTRVLPLKDTAGLVLRWFGTNTDISALKRAEEALRENETKYRSLFDNMINGFALHQIVMDEAGKPVDYIFREVNSAFEKLTGLKVADIQNKNVTQVMPGIEQDPADWIGVYGKVALTGEQLRFEQYAELLGKWYSVMVYSPKLYYFATVFEDITERKRADEALRSAHAELEHRAYELDAVNKELEAFAYTVSHDLKAPLRSIEGFTRAIAEDYSDKLDEPGRDYVRRVTAASQRMTELIDAMLNLSRLTGGELHEKTVDLGALAQGIVHNLKHNEPQRNVEFSILPKAPVKGDATMLQIVLQNLLENAWKFTGRHPAAQIEFGVTDMEGKAVYFVRDDGVGFDMQFADKLFQPFKRLHTDAEYPGLGIGLAIAHRIIMRHGGRMWAEADVNKGATFFFTL
jgi:PAS domain S-box-containing protein